MKGSLVSSLGLIFPLSSECAIIMAKLLDGYYRGLNSFYEIVKVCPNEVNDCQLLFSFNFKLAYCMYKVEKGDVYGIFSFGRKCPLIVEYGNFGK